MKRMNEVETDLTSKKIKTEFTKEDIAYFFNDQIWQSEFQNTKEEEVKNSSPYKWGTIKNLMDDTLLRKVREEVLSQIAFTKKETDIYKVYQSGDLANLSGLDWDDLSKLPSLFKLRAAIYSQEFRDVISKVTGSGKLSGVKTDMSINTYTKGCHLLTHDDVIGSRRVSFILYLPEPDKVWKPAYGGALRLFPAIVPNVPQTDFECKLVPQFNQIAFFTVQPGLSFHDVEEVREDRHRLSIQGWFHIPQPGEDGFVEGEQAKTEALSTLQQLQSKELQDYDFPKNIRDEINSIELKKIESDELTSDQIEYLSKYLNPKYLKDDVFKQLSDFFINESLIELKDIFKKEFADELHKQIRKTEINTSTPQKSSDILHPWKIAIPPHKQRYLYIDGKSDFTPTKEEIEFVNNTGPQELPNFSLLQTKEQSDTLLVEIAEFLKSIAFKKWLRKVTKLTPTTEQILLRRFRPGHDFILATTTDQEIARNETEENVLLEATLNLTPTAENSQNWESGDFGGYELCMAQATEDGEDDDPAIYKSNKDSDDDSVLCTNQCKWNSLTLMVRDPSVLKFVKYVSINAKGSRWDVSCQWNVKSTEEDDEDEENEEENGS